MTARFKARASVGWTPRQSLALVGVVALALILTPGCKRKKKKEAPKLELTAEKSEAEQRNLLALCKAAKDVLKMTAVQDRLGRMAEIAAPTSADTRLLDGLAAMEGPLRMGYVKALMEKYNARKDCRGALPAFDRGPPQPGEAALPGQAPPGQPGQPGQVGQGQPGQGQPGQGQPGQGQPGQGQPGQGQPGQAGQGQPGQGQPGQAGQGQPGQGQPGQVEPGQGAQPQNGGGQPGSWRKRSSAGDKQEGSAPTTETGGAENPGPAGQPGSWRRRTAPTKTP